MKPIPLILLMATAHATALDVQVPSVMVAGHQAEFHDTAISASCVKVNLILDDGSPNGWLPPMPMMKLATEKSYAISRLITKPGIRRAYTEGFNADGVLLGISPTKLFLVNPLHISASAPRTGFTGEQVTVMAMTDTTAVIPGMVALVNNMNYMPVTKNGDLWTVDIFPKMPGDVTVAFQAQTSIGEPMGSSNTVVIHILKSDNGSGNPPPITTPESTDTSKLGDGNVNGCGAGGGMGLLVALLALARKRYSKIAQ